MKNQPAFVATALRCLIAGFSAGIIVTIILGAIVMFLSTYAHAQDMMDAAGISGLHFDRPDDVKQGTLLFKSEADFTSAPILQTDTRIDVTGMIARTRVKQHFSNPDATWKEGIYVFPLPEDAAVDHMRLHIGDRVIEGQIKERQEAKRQYQQARNAGIRTSLVEQERPNIFTTSVANIGPHEEVIVEIEYQQLVEYDMERFSLRFPMVIGPRYIPGTAKVQGFAGNGWAENTDQVTDAARITPPVLHPGNGKRNPVSIIINLDTGFKLRHIESPYHEINIARPSATLYTITLKNGDIPADRDFVLLWKPVAGKAPGAALFKETKNGDDYALIMLLPPARETVQVLNREVIFVIDTSGSMAGTSIIQAKTALELALDRLKTTDTFNIIQFNSYTSQLFQLPMPASRDALNQAHYYIGSLQAQGGTEMAPAIRSALNRKTNHYDVRQVVFLTDGSVGNEQGLFDIIKQDLGDSRLFTIGIGSAPNSYFMNRAAQFGRGTHTYIGKTSEIQENMDRLLRKLERPVLSDIAISWPDMVAIESWPQKFPDLYLSEPLLITVKSPSLPAQLQIAGRIAGKTWQTDLSLNGGLKKQGVAELWARRKIAALMNQQHNNPEQEAIRKLIIDTALEHHLVSKYTSLIAVDITPVRKHHEAMQQHPLPVNLPEGWQYDNVFGVMPRTATPASLYLMTGLMLLICNWILSSAINAGRYKKTAHT